MTNDYISNFYWTGYWLAFCGNLAVMYYNFSIYLMSDSNYRYLNLTLHPFTGSVVRAESQRNWLKVVFSFIAHVVILFFTSFFSWASFLSLVVGNHIENANTPEKIKHFRFTMRRADLNQYKAVRANIILNDGEPSDENIKAHVEAINSQAA